MAKKLFLIFSIIFLVSVFCVYSSRGNEIINTYNFYCENENWKAEFVIKKISKNSSSMRREKDILYYKTLTLTYKKDLINFNNIKIFEYSFRDGSNEVKENMILNNTGIKNKILTLSSASNIPNNYNQNHIIEVVIIRDNKKEILHLKSE